MRPKLAIIAAIADNGVIGKANGLPKPITLGCDRMIAIAVGACVCRDQD